MQSEVGEVEMRNENPSNMFRCLSNDDYVPQSNNNHHSLTHDMQKSHHHKRVRLVYILHGFNT